MSAPSISDIRFTFMDANFVLQNKKGEPVFEMKRKNPIRPDGTEDCYYIFKFHEENMPDKRTEKRFKKTFDEIICPAAAMLDIGMFSFDEITERCHEQLEKIYRGGRRITQKQVDVKIELYNYATKRLGTLIVGVSVPKGNEKWMKGLGK